MTKKPKSIQHRTPTSATLKELYANAYCCAFPKCPRPLYKVDSETGTRTLNSNASHISARSEGGPRWDENQSEAANRAVNNLLALCLEHAKEIDDIKNVSQYPAPKLLEWKKQQLADFDALGKQGWSVRDEDIENLNQHFNSVETSISNSIIDLGGKGGTAPGAGGGGGGVLGSINSKGGDGGKGGNTIILNGTAATAPGAGGGGAGVLGEGAVASEGGGGGEKIEEFLSVNEFDSIDFQIGEGGKNGKSGGDTIAKFIKDGKVVRELVAKGGKVGQPGKHGNLSSRARPLVKKELEVGAGISAILLTELARFKNGLVTLLDAGWETYQVPTFPYATEWPLFLALSTIGLTSPTVISCSVRVKDPQDNVAIELPILFSKLDDVVLRVSVAQVLAFELTQSGLWEVEIISGDLILANLPIAVFSQAV